MMDKVKIKMITTNLTIRKWKLKVIKILSFKAKRIIVISLWGITLLKNKLEMKKRKKIKINCQTLKRNKWIKIKIMIKINNDRYKKQNNSNKL
jgi:hypothetical protein